MRIHQRLTALTSCLASLVVGTSLLAQSPYGPQGFGGQTTGQALMAPPPFQPAFSTNNPAVLYPPGAPPHSYPFPNISPHLAPNVLQDQHYNRNGTWFHEIIQRNRETYFAAEAMRMHFDGPGDNYVGSAPAVVRNDTGEFFNGDTDFVGGRRFVLPTGEGDAGNLALGQYARVGPGAFPYPWIQVDDMLEQLVTVVPRTPWFPIRKVSVFEDNPSSPGFKLRAGFFNEDGTGFGAEGWYAFQNNEFFKVGNDRINGIPITQSLIAGVDITPFIGFPDDFDGPFNNGITLINVLVGGLPLNENSGVIDTLFPDAGFTGTTQKFDLLYRLDIASEAGSANVNFYLGNLVRSKSMRATAFASARYLYFDEFFGFRGVDSGFGYDLTDLVGETTFRPDEVFGPIYPLLDSRLQSYTTSNLAGPELGLRVDLGRSKAFKIWMQGSAGLMVNHERLQVRGENIGNAEFFRSLAPFGFGSDLVGDPSLDMFGNDTRFDDVQRHTHISPTFNFGINAEMDVLGAIPLIKLVPLVKHAQLTLGYNFLFVGELARPAQTIHWRGFPEFPSVRNEHDNFEAHQLSAGLTFER